MKRSTAKERVLRKQDLTSERRRLLVLCETVNHGRFQNLIIRGKQPVFDPPPIIQREYKFGGHNGPRPESQLDDFVLKKEFCELFAYFDELVDGVVVNLEVRAGLPLVMTIEERAA